MMSTHLPEGYAALEPFVAKWAVGGMNARALARGDSTADERQAFYDAARDLIGPALDSLDAKPLDALDEREQCLLRLALSFAHVALAVEIQGPDEGKHAELRSHMPITRNPADIYG
ncbi:MAG: hypothetical protein QM676_00705 [Novosphingobium sp.]